MINAFFVHHMDPTNKLMGMDITRTNGKSIMPPLDLATSSRSSFGALLFDLIASLYGPILNNIHADKK